MNYVFFSGIHSETFKNSYCNNVDTVYELKANPFITSITAF